MLLPVLDSSQAPLLLPLGISTAVEQGDSKQDFESLGQTHTLLLPGPHGSPHSQQHQAPHLHLEALSPTAEKVPGHTELPGQGARSSSLARGSSLTLGERVQHLGA